MAKCHESFLLRCWQMEDADQRIEIEHIQSGQHQLVRSLTEALDWIDDRQRERRCDAPMTWSRRMLNPNAIG